MKYLVLITLVIGSNAYSAGSKMKNVDIYCASANEESFIAINVADQRAWTGEGKFVAGARAVELSAVKAAKLSNSMKFEAVMEVGWGSSTYINKIEGTIKNLGGSPKFYGTSTPISNPKDDVTPQDLELDCTSL